MGVSNIDAGPKSPTFLSDNSERLTSLQAGNMEQPGVETNTQNLYVLETESELGMNQDELRLQLQSEFSESWFDFLTFRGSVALNALAPTMVFTLWGAIWTVVFLQTTSVRYIFPNTVGFLSVVSFVVSLILGYRTNAAYDRYYEARKVWGALLTNCRNLARCIWVSVNAKKDSQDEREQLGAINLVLAFAVSTKHLLRGELGPNYSDLAHLLMHTPMFQVISSNEDESESLPVDILLLLTDYVNNVNNNGILDGTSKTVMNGFIAGLIECLTNLERIRNTPIPLAYAIHLKHVLVIFLMALPFQLPQYLGWLTIPTIAIASYTLVGIECMSNEVEQPFGYDHNDLKLNEFCDQLRQELLLLITSKSGRKRGVDTWKFK